MERAIFFSGMGGQGVQLASRTLAVAAIKSGMNVLVFGTYGGSMRGGNTDSTIVIGQGPLSTPPVVDTAWAALMMHHMGWDALRPKLQRGAFVLVDESIVREQLVHEGRTLTVRASALATDAGMKKAGSMVALGAFVGATGIVSLERLTDAAMEVLPPYRAQFAAVNARALELGYRQVPHSVAPAWQAEEVEA